MPQVLNENMARTGHFIVREANGYRSRHAALIAAGAGKLNAGAVLGKITASGKYAPLNPGAGDGSETAVAVLYEGCDATDGDVRRTMIVRDAEIHADVLIYADGVTDAQKTAALADLASAGLIAR